MQNKQNYVKNSNINNINNINNNLTWEEFYTKIFKNIPKENKKNHIHKYILNEKNTFVTKEYIDHLLTVYNINHKCNDLKLFQIGLTHPSYTYNRNYEDLKEFKSIFMGINVLGGEQFDPILDTNINMAIPLQPTSYERLEFLGDSILRQILSDYVFIRYPELQEGGLTKLRAQLENATNLAQITRKIKLNKYVIIARNYEFQKSRDKSEKIQCDIFEAFLAALYLDVCKIKYCDIGTKFNLIQDKRDKAYQICHDFVTSLLESEIDIPCLLSTYTNYKDQLMHYFHSKDWGDPKYFEIERILDEKFLNKKTFKMCVRDPENNIIGIGVSSTKQNGEKIAAKQALIKYGLITNNDEDYELSCNDPIINK